MRIGIVGFIIFYAPSAMALPGLADSIPNAFSDELLVGGQPCLLCHLSSGGGGDLNSFGEDFDRLGRWSQLAAEDSDGDQQSNGFELGDPRGVWTRGATPERESNLSFPGDPNSRTMGAPDAGFADTGIIVMDIGLTDTGTGAPDSGVISPDAGVELEDTGPADSGVADPEPSPIIGTEVICACGRVPSDASLPVVVVAFGALALLLRRRRRYAPSAEPRSLAR